MRRRRREETEAMMREEEDGGEGRSRRSPVQRRSEVFRIRLSLPSWSTKWLLMGVMLMMMGGVVEGLQCQCSRSTESAHCSRELCDIKERDGKVPACVFVRDGPHQHYACIRVEEEKEMGCRVMRGGTGGHKVACMCRDADMCNVDLSDRVDDGGENQRILKVPAELIGEPSIVRVKAEERREGRRHDVLLEPDRDDTLGVAPSVVDFFDEENEVGVGRGGKGGGRGGGLIQRDRESWSEEEEKRGSSSAYRLVHGVDNGQLVPLTVKRLGEERRSKLEENIIDLTKPNYRRPDPPSPPRPPPSLHQTTRRPDWRQTGAQPVPRGPYEAAREEWEKQRKRLEMEQRVHRVELTTKSRLPPSPPSTTTPLPPPPPPSRPPTPFSISRINSFVERPSPDPVPYPRQRWDDRPYPLPTTTTTEATKETTTETTTPPPTRRSYSVSVSKYVVSSTTTVSTTVPTTTIPSTTTTTEPTTTTTSTTLAPTTTTTVPTTTTATPTTTVRSTVAPTTTVVYDDMDGGEEEEYDDVVLPAGMKSNTVPRVQEKSPDSGTINTIWTTVIVTALFIGALW